jgi:hypothetical protein
MSGTIQVEAARIPDRDRLLAALSEHGLDARAIDEVGIEVRCGKDTEQMRNEVYEHVESMIMVLGAPFVPVKHEGVIYIRPPVD